MRASLARLSRAYLNKLHPHEKSILFAAARIQNEIRFCVRGLHAAMAFKHDSPIVMKAQLSLQLFQVRLLAGKLFEGSCLIDRFYFHKKRSDLQKAFQVYVCDGEDGAKVEKEYLRDFDGEYLRSVRNKLSFHFDQHELELQFAQMPDELELLIGMPDGCEGREMQIVHYYIEAMLGHALISKVESCDERHAFAQATERVNRSAVALLKFSNCLIFWILSKGGREAWDGEAPHPEDLYGIPRETSVCLPCFFEL